ncbi:MAG: WD40 repeat domain-containing protein [Elusimicrobia bacterium]|nr:WD40 repeat domain-containing protein [Elusimicrobiota bacterium]
MEQTTLLKTLTGHADGVLALAFSPCGKFLATAGEDNYLRLWDAAAGIEIQSIEAHKGDVRAVVFDSDGDLFATASWDRTVKIWKTADCSLLGQAEKHSAPVNCLAFSPDDKLLYSGSDDAQIGVFSSPSCSHKGVIKPKIGDIKALAVSPHGVIAAGGVELRLLSASGDLLKDNDSYMYGVRGLAFSPDGKRLAVATGMEKRLEIWDMDRLLELGSVKDNDWINCAVFTRDGKYVATGGGSAVKLWDPATGTCLKTFEGHSDEIYGVDVSPDGRYIASASNDKTVKLWSLS